MYIHDNNVGHDNYSNVHCCGLMISILSHTKLNFKIVNYQNTIKLKKCSQ